MITRRGLLTGIFVAGTAPAIVRAGILMPIRPTIITPAHGYLATCSCTWCLANYDAWWKRDIEGDRMRRLVDMHLRKFVETLDPRHQGIVLAMRPLWEKTT